MRTEFFISLLKFSDTVFAASVAFGFGLAFRYYYSDISGNTILNTDLVLSIVLGFASLWFVIDDWIGRRKILSKLKISDEISPYFSSLFFADFFIGLFALPLIVASFGSRMLMVVPLLVILFLKFSWAILTIFKSREIDLISQTNLIKELAASVLSVMVILTFGFFVGIRNLDHYISGDGKIYIISCFILYVSYNRWFAPMLVRLIRKTDNSMIISGTKDAREKSK